MEMLAGRLLGGGGLWKPLLKDPVLVFCQRGGRAEGLSAAKLSPLTLKSPEKALNGTEDAERRAARGREVARLATRDNE